MKNVVKRTVLSTIIVGTMIATAGCTANYTSGVIQDKTAQTKDGVTECSILVELNDGSSEWWSITQDIYSILEVGELVTKSVNDTYSLG